MSEMPAEEVIENISVAGAHEHPHDHPHDHPDIMAEIVSVQASIQAQEAIAMAEAAAAEAAVAAEVSVEEAVETKTDLELLREEMALRFAELEQRMPQAVIVETTPEPEVTPEAEGGPPPEVTRSRKSKNPWWS